MKQEETEGTEERESPPLPGICSGPCPCHCTRAAVHAHTFSNTDRTDLVACVETQPGTPTQPTTAPRERQLGWNDKPFSSATALFSRRRQVQSSVMLTIMVVDWQLYSHRSSEGSTGLGPHTSGLDSGAYSYPSHASRCALAAAPFPSPPLEERGRERRPLFSASPPDMLMRQPRWDVAMNRRIENGDGPPLPSPLLQRMRGGAARPLLASARCG